MTLLMSIVLGLVQGFTEFLPVSSSGHLVLTRELFGFGLDAGDSFLFFDILLHLGTLIAVFIAFFPDIKELVIEGFKMIGDKFRINNNPNRKFIVLILVSMIPMILVLPFMDKIEGVFSTPLMVGIALLYTSVILFISDRVKTSNKTPLEASYKNALFVGFMQAVAVIPGVSRSGSTMTAGLFSGFNREFAVKFAFIMSIPVIIGANVINMPDAIVQMQSLDIPIYIYIAGILSAAISGLLAIKMVKYIMRNKKFKVFAVYCAVVGILSIIASFVM